MVTLMLDGELDIYRAAPLKDLLLEALAAADRDGHGLELNLAGVTELDSAGLQLLMLAKKDAQRRQRELHLVAHSPAVVEVFELLNVGAFFGDPMVIANRD